MASKLLHSINSGGLSFSSAEIRVKWNSIGFLTVLLLLASEPAKAQSDFYAGKTITIVAGSSPGGGYDTYARAVARFLGNHIPGKPNIIVQNMPAGGSLSAVLHLDAGAPKDGTVITIFNPGLITDAITDPEKAKVDFRKLAWVGSANRSFRMCYFWHASGINKWSDLSGPKIVTLGATGVNSGSYNDVGILKNLMKQNVRAILGYPGRSEVHLAIERGELDGECGTPEGIPENWIRDKKLNVVVRTSKTKTPSIPEGVPWLGEFITSAEDLQVLTVLTAANELGRPFVASSQIPRERLQILRAAFEATMRDKEFLALAEKQNLSIDPATGEEAEKIIVEIYQVPKAAAERASEVIK